MKVKDLIDSLSWHDEEAEVKLAHQPNHPMEYSIGDVVATIVDDKEIVYITEGGKQGYLRTSRDELGW